MRKKPALGIADIGVYEPGKEELNLPNAWFEELGIIGRKFVQHTGIRERGISFLPEEEMALRAVRHLQEQTGMDLRNCAGLVLSSSSLLPTEDDEWRKQGLGALGPWEDLHKRLAPLTGIPPSVLRHLRLDDALLRGSWLRRSILGLIGITRRKLARVEEMLLAPYGTLDAAAWRIGEELGLPPGSTRGINWGCSGYVKGWEMLRGEGAETLAETRGKFLLLVTASRHSKFLDFGDRETGTLFGDYATATLVTAEDHPTCPPRLLLRHASTAQPLTRDLSREAVLKGDALFGYERRENVLYPTPDGGAARDAERFCWTMDGNGVFYAAEPAIVGAMDRALAEGERGYADVDWILGHQPGKMMMRHAAEGLRRRGYAGRIPDDLTEETGNITCASIPYALRRYWGQLRGIIASPAIGMHAPGSDRMSQGCLLFEVKEPKGKAGSVEENAAVA